MSEKRFIPDEEEDGKVNKAKAKGPKAKEPSLRSHPTLNAGPQATLPPLVCRCLSSAAFRVLEHFRGLTPGAKKDTGYDDWPLARATVAKGLKELRAVGILSWERRHNADGNVAGITVTYLGLPGETGEEAKTFFRSPWLKRREAIDKVLKEIEAGDQK